MNRSPYWTDPFRINGGRAPSEYVTDLAPGRVAVFFCSPGESLDLPTVEKQNAYFADMLLGPDQATRNVEKWAHFRADVGFPGRKTGNDWADSSGQKLKPEWALSLPLKDVHATFRIWQSRGWQIKLHGDWDSAIWNRIAAHHMRQGRWPHTYGLRDDSTKTVYLKSVLYDVRIPEYQSWAIEYGTWVARSNCLAGLIMGHKPTYYLADSELQGAARKWLREVGDNNAPLFPVTEYGAGEWADGQGEILKGLVRSGVRMCVVFEKGDLKSNAGNDYGWYWCPESVRQYIEARLENVKVS